MRLPHFTARPRGWLAIGLIGAIGIGASVARAQQATTPAPRIEVKTFYTSPAAEPVPALEYRFWPSWNELEPGNAVPLYLRAVIMTTSFGSQERWKAYAELTETGVPDPDDTEAIEAAREWLEKHGSQSIFDELRRATYREEADYGLRIEAIPGTEQFSFLLPEIQELRSLARMLDLRIRVAIADREYDEAIALLRDGFRLAGSVRETRLLVTQLVGAAIAGMMLEDVRLLSEAPGAPNLYWALASLPRPLISLRSSIAFEADMAQRMLPEPPNAAIGPEGWNETLFDVLADASQLSSASVEQPWLRRVMITAGVMQVYPEAKASLIAEGLSEAEIEAMPVAEAVVVYLRRQMRNAGDDLQKWSLLPPDIRQSTAASRKDPLAVALGAHQAAFDPVRLLIQLLPGIDSAARVESRYQAQIDAALTVEAIRAHAAAHDGQFPERLDQLEPLPALPDPRTGEPFEWEVRSVEGVTEGVLRLADLYQPGITREYHVRIEVNED